MQCLGFEFDLKMFRVFRGRLTGVKEMLTVTEPWIQSDTSMEYLKIITQTWKPSLNALK